MHDSAFNRQRQTDEQTAPHDVDLNDQQQLWRSALKTLDLLAYTQAPLRWSKVGPHRSQLIDRGWLVHDHFRPTIDVPVGHTGQSLDLKVVDVNERFGTCVYADPLTGALTTAPLDHIRMLRFDVQALLDALAEALHIAPRFAPQRLAPVLPHHLWHLGDVRVGHTHVMAPLFFFRRGTPNITQDDVFMARFAARLNDDRFAANGLILSPPLQYTGWQWIERWAPQRSECPRLPNGHRWLVADELMNAHGVDHQCVQQALTPRPATQDSSTNESFDPATGVLLLAHLERPVVLDGVQRAIVKLLWDAPQPLPWREIKRRVGSASRGIDDAFRGKPQRELFIAAVDRGRFAMRRRRGSD